MKKSNIVNADEVNKNVAFIRQDLSLRLTAAYLEGIRRTDILECDDELKRLFDALYDYVTQNLALPDGVEVVDEYVGLIVEKSEK